MAPERVDLQSQLQGLVLRDAGLGLLAAIVAASVASAMGQALLVFPAFLAAGFWIFLRCLQRRCPKCRSYVLLRRWWLTNGFVFVPRRCLHCGYDLQDNPEGLSL